MLSNNSYFQNMSFVKHLLAKSELVRRWYLRNFDKDAPGDIRLSESEIKLLNSMERFHRLSHVRYERMSLCTKDLFIKFPFSKEEWLSYLPSVEKKVGLRENMSVNENLKTFLDNKRQSSNVQDQVNILEVFEPVVPDIEKMYKKKLEDRNNIEEFDTEKIANGMDIEDGVFLERYFVPSCIVFIYQSWLEVDLDEETIYPELFTLGTGSKSYTLLPEVTAICEKCSDEMFLGWRLKTQSEIRQMNVHIFKRLSSLNFDIPGLNSLCESDDDSDDAMIHCNPFDSDEHESSPKSEQSKSVHVNPFDDSEASSEDELFLDACDICNESFPSAQFVDLHKSIFHGCPAVKTKFVDDPECLITTFIASPSSTLDASKAPSPTTPSSSYKVPEDTVPECAVKDVAEGLGSERVTKYFFRKRLKYSS